MGWACVDHWKVAGADPVGIKKLDKQRGKNFFLRRGVGIVSINREKTVLRSRPGGGEGVYRQGSTG